ncbi:hypothetical protein IWX84_001898 [Flavobacterium sp. CG_9.10]|nr:hypothetical protein [Flavobacterium sp. CG_9.10]MBG6111014.1 hypothetical protein [Flavobacterium sp. CG_9.10]
MFHNYALIQPAYTIVSTEEESGLAKYNVMIFHSFTVYRKGHYFIVI